MAEDQPASTSEEVSQVPLPPVSQGRREALLRALAVAPVILMVNAGRARAQVYPSQDGLPSGCPNPQGNNPPPPPGCGTL
ncbi:MAG TPA: hypothetical protein VED46_10675 [Alphaproteobacteria bacterium]|nr:hypothetical protein [Alphaproteobacteria bacterium]